MWIVFQKYFIRMLLTFCYHQSAWCDSLIQFSSYKSYKRYSRSNCYSLLGWFATLLSV
ncbi:hypothetical protein ACRRTK_008945 [Alexandromys fortis]